MWLWIWLCVYFHYSCQKQMFELWSKQQGATLPITLKRSQGSSPLKAEDLSKRNRLPIQITAQLVGLHNWHSRTDVSYQKHHLRCWLFIRQLQGFFFSKQTTPQLLSTDIWKQTQLFQWDCTAQCSEAVLPLLLSSAGMKVLKVPIWKHKAFL